MYVTLYVSLSPSSGSPVSVADKGGRPTSHGVSPTSSNHQGLCLTKLNHMLLSAVCLTATIVTVTTVSTAAPYSSDLLFSQMWWHWHELML